VPIIKPAQDEAKQAMYVQCNIQALPAIIFAVEKQ